jgi:ankyrin repeat protein
VCELLLDRGANINAIKLDGNTALHLCAVKDMAAVARLLIKKHRKGGVRYFVQESPILP